MISQDELKRNGYELDFNKNPRRIPLTDDELDRRQREMDLHWEQMEKEMEEEEKEPECGNVNWAAIGGRRG